MSLHHRPLLKDVFQLGFDTELMDDAMEYCDCNASKLSSLARPFDVSLQRQTLPVPIGRADQESLSTQEESGFSVEVDSPQPQVFKLRQVMGFER